MSGFYYCSVHSCRLSCTSCRNKSSIYNRDNFKDGMPPGGFILFYNEPSSAITRINLVYYESDKTY